MNVFNTGRQYTAAGQIIFWEQQPSGLVYFNDVSRSVDGVLLAPRYGVADDSYVLRGYDHSSYDVRDQYHAPFGSYDSGHFQKWVNDTRILDRNVK